MWRLVLGRLIGCVGLEEPANLHACPVVLDEVVWSSASKPWVPGHLRTDCEVRDELGGPVDGDWAEVSDDFGCAISQFSPTAQLTPGEYEASCGNQDLSLRVTNDPVPTATAGYVSLNLYSGSSARGREAWGSVQLVGYDDLTLSGGWLEVHMLGQTRMLNRGFVMFDVAPDGELDVVVIPVSPDGTRFERQRLRLELDIE